MASRWVLASCLMKTALTRAAGPTRTKFTSAGAFPCTAPPRGRGPSPHTAVRGGRRAGNGPGAGRYRHLRAGAAEGSPRCPVRAPAQPSNKLRGKGNLPPPRPLPLTGRDRGVRKRRRLRYTPPPPAPQSSTALSRALLPLTTSAEGPSVPALLPSPRHGVPARPPATHPGCEAAGEGRRDGRTQRKGASGCSRAPETSWQGPPSRTLRGDGGGEGGEGGRGEGHGAPGCPPLPQERGRAASGWWRCRRQPALLPFLPFPSLPSAPPGPGRTGRQRREEGEGGAATAAPSGGRQRGRRLPAGSGLPPRPAARGSRPLCGPPALPGAAGAPTALFVVLD